MSADGWPWQDGECVPADSSHPSGPRGAHERLSALIVPLWGQEARLLKDAEQGTWCGRLLAAFCPAFPRPHEQIFRVQHLDLMSVGSRDHRRPGVREQELVVLYNHLKSLMQSAGGCEVPEVLGRGMQKYRPLLSARTLQGAGGPHSQPPPASPTPCPSSLFPNFFKGADIMTFITKFLLQTSHLKKLF